MGLGGCAARSSTNADRSLRDSNALPIPVLSSSSSSPFCWYSFVEEGRFRWSLLVLMVVVKKVGLVSPRARPRPRARSIGVKAWTEDDAAA